MSTILWFLVASLVGVAVTELPKLYLKTQLDNTPRYAKKLEEEMEEMKKNQENINKGLTDISAVVTKLQENVTALSGVINEIRKDGMRSQSPTFTTAEKSSTFTTAENENTNKGMTDISAVGSKLQENMTASAGVNNEIRKDEMGACPPDYHKSTDPPLCYKIHLEKILWTEARDACSARGERLMFVDTEEKFTVVKDAIRSNATTKGGVFSLGAQDLDHDGVWNWLDGTRVTYSAWRPGHPGKGGGCLNLNPGAAHLWNDAVCTRLFSYICEKTLL